MKKQVLGTAALLLLAGLSPLAQAAGTLAGTDITNTASATFDDPDNPGSKKTVDSNPSTLRVDELLNVTITPNGGTVSVSPGDTSQVMSFTMTNVGNGPEQYVLSTNGALGSNDFNPTNIRVYFDTNDDGIFDPLVDTLYVPSGVLGVAGNEPTLGPDESVRLFVVSDIPATQVDGITPVANGDQGNLELLAEAITAQETAGTDPAGHVFVGSGTNGSDAIVGNTQAVGTANNAYVVSSIQTNFSKTSTVIPPASHPEYGTNPLPGSTIRYTLTLEITGSGSLSNIEIVDRIPANTTFVNSSITLDGVTLTDVSGDDDGELRTGAGVNPPRDVVVRVSTATAPRTYVVTFDVTID